MNKTGFGCLRLPLCNADDPKSVDLPYLEKMVDRFLELGGNYFDTAYTYEGSEAAVRKALVERHPRISYRLANKLPGWKAENYDQCRTLFNEQLERCGVEYFDVYLLHSMTEANYRIAQRADQFRFLRELKEKGLAKAIGFSYHDSPELLDEILTEHPEVDYVQLQINYLDWDNPAIQSEKCYEVAARHNKKVTVMETVKGGNLSKLPEEATELLKKCHKDWSVSSWAVRFATSLENVETVLSGMNTVEQIEDNLQPFVRLNETEKALLMEVARIIRKNTAIGCTACGYCLEGCPRGIPIPRIFRLYNEYARFPKDDWHMKQGYIVLARENAPASDCLECGACEGHCPQKLPIREWLKAASKVFD